MAAAAKLAADGAAAEPGRALFAYNRSRAYVATVVAWALAYGWAPSDAALLAFAVAHHPHVALRPAAGADVAAGRVDARLLRLVLVLATTHRLGRVGPFVTGHAATVAGTDRRSHHADGRAVDVAVVNGAPVTVANAAAREVAEAAAALPPALRPDELGSPWELVAEGVDAFSADHHDHLHLAYAATLVLDSAGARAAQPPQRRSDALWDRPPRQP